jgi:polar amino acid transport system substrate-binding protein
VGAARHAGGGALKRLLGAAASIARRDPRRALLAVAGLAALAWAFVSWIAPAWRAGRDFDRLLASRALRVGTDPSFRPMSFFDADGWRGVDADMAARLATRLDLQLQPIPVGFDGRYDALDSGIVDVVISAVAVDPTQTERVTHSIGYLDAGPRLLLSPHTAGVDALTALARARVAVALGGASDRAARYLERRSVDMRRVAVTTDAAALALLRSGDVDAALIDGFNALQLGCPATGDALSADRALRCAPAAPNMFVVLTRKRDARLSERIDRELSALLQTGEIDVIARKWFSSWNTDLLGAPASR